MFIVCMIAAILVPYLLCGINTAIIVTKIKSGKDIRDLGSGNAGLTNTLRTQGKAAAVFVLIGDILKGVLSIIIIHLLFRYLTGIDTYSHSDGWTWINYLSGIFAVIGHVFPVYYGFKGGKGIACTAGYTIYLSIQYTWLFFLMGLVSFFVPFNLFHIVSVCSLFYYTCLFIMTIVYGQMGGFGVIGTQIPQSALIEVYVILFLLTALAYFQHRGNIKKLLAGKERKTYIFK